MNTAAIEQPSVNDDTCFVTIPIAERGRWWFTSDEHYDHKNIITYSKRPFRDVAEMQEELIRRHNALVRPGDNVVHLGDFAFNTKTLRAVLPRLNGDHMLIAGNHDACHPCHRAWKRERDRYIEHGFSRVHARGYFRVDEPGLEFFKANHMPYVGDHYDERYKEFRPRDDGHWLLHGHVHEKWRVRGRMINVGVDQWSYGPVALTNLISVARHIIERLPLSEWY